MNPLVVMPTYNEVDNVRALVPEICRLSPDLRVLVVDDDSPDGTAAAVTTLSDSHHGRVRLLEHGRRAGLGRAYLDGFRRGLQSDRDTFVQMDADYSHRPADLARLLAAGAEADVDFVVGSRWVDGGGTVNWGRGRRFISRGGSFYARRILGYDILDWTGGFNLWKRHVLEALRFDSIRSEGYSFQIELKYRALRHGFRGREVPITFEDRRVGESKMSSRIVLEALYRVWLIRLSAAAR